MNALRRAIAASAAGPAAAAGSGAARGYRFAPGFPGFSGHFPGDPVLPAIVQMMAVATLAGEQAGRPLRLAAVRAAKFLAPIRPGDEVLVRYESRTEGGARLYDAAVTVAGRPAATFLLELAEDEETA